MRNQPEFRLTCVVADTLRLRGIEGLYWTHLPFGEARSERTGARLKRMGTRAGAPDFLMILRGKAIGLELKTATGRQTETQRETEALWTLSGGLYFVAKGYDAAIQFLEMVGAIKPDRSRINKQ